jgi:hypothetical protein
MANHGIKLNFTADGFLCSEWFWFSFCAVNHVSLLL